MNDTTLIGNSKKTYFTQITLNQPITSEGEPVISTFTTLDATVAAVKLPIGTFQINASSMLLDEANLVSWTAPGMIHKTPTPKDSNSIPKEVAKLIWKAFVAAYIAAVGTPSILLLAIGYVPAHYCLDDVLTRNCSRN